MRFLPTIWCVLALMIGPAHAGSITLIGAGKAVGGGGGGPTTIFSASPALNADDSNPNTSFRIVIPVTGATSTQVRVTFQASTATGLTTGHASIGKYDTSTPTLPSTLATPLELKFSAASGFAIAAGASITSDWLTLSGFSLTAGEKAVVIFDCTTPAGQRLNAANTGVVTWFQTTPSWNVANTAGMGFNDLVNTNYAIVSVETQ